MGRASSPQRTSFPCAQESGERGVRPRSQVSSAPLSFALPGQDAAKTAAMNRARAVGAQRLQMDWRAIADVTVEVIPLVLFVYPPHVSIPLSLGQDRGGGHRKRNRVSVDQSHLGNRQLASDGIEQGEVRQAIKLLQGALHAKSIGSR